MRADGEVWRRGSLPRLFVQCEKELTWILKDFIERMKKCALFYPGGFAIMLEAWCLGPMAERRGMGIPLCLD